MKLVGVCSDTRELYRWVRRWQDRDEARETVTKIWNQRHPWPKNQRKEAL